MTNLTKSTIFAQQGSRDGCCENPPLYVFGNQEHLLNVVQSNLIKEMKKKTRVTQCDDPKIDIHDDRTLSFNGRSG